MTDDELNRQQAASDGVTPEVEAMLKELASAALQLGMISGAERQREGKAAPWVAAEFMAADARLGAARAALVAEVRRLREALAWYADARHFERRIEYGRDENPYEGGSEADSDGGDRARAALEGGAS